jgi:hypothetical protein
MQRRFDDDHVERVDDLDRHVRVPVTDDQPDDVEDPDENRPATSTPAQVPRRPGFDRPWGLIVTATGLSLILYVVLRPENYALTPNSLDPVFYTGYSINFDDVMNAVGDRHYFVSRWSAYLPMYVADMAFGPVAGRLFWRLVLAVALVAALWLLGRRWRWTLPQRLLIGTVVLSTPMFVRAFFSDYVEYLVVGLGVVLVCLALKERHRWWSASLFGVLGGLVFVANPIAITMLALTGVCCLVVGARGLRERVWLASVAAGSGVVVVVAGLLLFRWNYGIPNVYQPSIDFLRNYQPPVVDDWKSPRLEWLEKYTWLYSAPLILVTAGVLALRRAVKFDRVEIAALLLCGVQYSYQWFDQFVRGGYGLELSFYWSFSLPPYLVALAVVLGRLSSGVGTRHLVAVGVSWVAFLAVGVPAALELPAGLWLLPLSLVVVAGVARFGPRIRAAALALILALTGWLQVGAPAYDPTAYWYLNTSPRYDLLFRNAGSPSEMMFSEAVWFEEQMDRVLNDASTSFVVHGGWSKAIVGLYAPHVVGRVVTLSDDGTRLTEIAKAEIKSGSRPIVAVFGPPDEVASMVATFPSDLGVGTVLLDETHTSALGYRLVVYRMPDATRLPFTWRGDALPVANGTVVGSEVRVGPRDSPGFVTFGPYQLLQPGRYRLEIAYRSSLDPSESAGSADVSSTEASTIASAQLPGTDGRSGTAALEFEVASNFGTARWEFRSTWSGLGEFVVESFTLSAA